MLSSLSFLWTSENKSVGVLSRKLLISLRVWGFFPSIECKANWQLNFFDNHFFYLLSYILLLGCAHPVLGGCWGCVDDGH